MSALQVIDSQDGWQVPVNENFYALRHQTVYAKAAATTGGLNWGYYGGRWGGFDIADGALVLSPSATTYVTVTRATGAVVGSTDATAYNDLANNARVGTLTTSSLTITTEQDDRVGPGGVHGSVSASALPVGTFILRGDLDCSASPNYPIGVAGDTYDVLVAGLIGGASGAVVAAGDTIYCRAAAAAGDQATVGASWVILQANLPVDIDGAMAANSDLVVPSQKAVRTFVASQTLVAQNSKSAAYTTVLTDANKHLLHPSADTTARTFTIASNANVPYPIGSAITFVNQNAAGVLTIAIQTDVMRLAGPGTTGSRTLAANGMATALKIAATEWIISGTGLT